MAEGTECMLYIPKPPENKRFQARECDIAILAFRKEIEKNEWLCVENKVA